VSQMAPERAAPRKENVFTRKIGPLSMWVWLVIIGGGILAYSLYKSKTAGSTSSTSAAGTDASQVPQFVNQTYTTVTPPVAGPPPTTGPIPTEPPPFHRPPPGPARRPPRPGEKETRTERLRHRGNLLQIAKRNGIDEEDLLEANPELQKYKGTGRQLPVGTVVRIPPAAA
jgi:LysM domain